MSFWVAGERKEDMLETAKTLSALRVDGVKNPLRARVERYGAGGDVSARTYACWNCPNMLRWSVFLEYLAPEMVIHRLVGDAPRSRYVAPEWGLHKSEALRQIDLELEREFVPRNSLC